MEQKEMKSFWESVADDFIAALPLLAMVLACVAILAVLLSLSSCKSKQHVVADTEQGRVVEQVVKTDSVSKTDQLRKRDSVVMVSLRADSVYRHDIDSVQEVLVVDTSGKILSRDTYHVGNHYHDAYHFADVRKKVDSKEQNEQSSMSNQQLVAKKDSSLLKVRSEITKKPAKEPKKKSGFFAAVKNTFLWGVGIVLVLLAVIGGWFVYKYYRNWKKIF